MKYIFRGILILVLLVIVAVAASFFGPSIWESIRGEPDYSVTLPADARLITDRYDILSVKGEDGEEHPVILPRSQPPLPPPDRFTTGPEARVAANAEDALRAGGIPADVYVINGSTTGEPMMVISLNLSRGLPSSGQEMTETINELIHASRSEGVDLGGIAAVLHGDSGEPLVAVSTSAGELRAFGDGEIPIDEAMDHLGLSIVDRGALIDLLTGLRQ